MAENRKMIVDNYFHVFVLLIATLCHRALSTTPTVCTPTDRPDIKCLAVNEIGFEKCRPDTLKDKFPHLYNNSADFTPAKPSDFSGDLFDRKYSDTYPDFYPGVNLTFKTPSDGSISFLKGFEMMIYRFDPESAGTAASQSCVIFDISTVSFSVSDYASPFLYTLYPLTGQQQYHIELYSLPKPPINHDQFASYMFTTSSLRTEQSFPKDWVTSISYQVNYSFESKARVVFQFLPPPKEYKFTEFLVLLVDPTGTPKTIQENHTSTFSHEFKHVESGVYEIWIEPIDDFRYENGKCYCSGQSGRCEVCIVSKTPPFNVTNIVPAVTSSTSMTSTGETNDPNVGAVTGDGDEENDTTKNILAAVGSLIGLCLIILLAVFVYRRTKRNRDQADINKKDPEDREQEVVDEWFRLPYKTVNENRDITRKLIFLLYFQDHDYHIEAVESLVDYLQTYCSCDVLYAPWHLSDIMEEGKHLWSLKSLQRADFTLVIHSEASFRHYMAWRDKKNYEGHDAGPLGDMFIPAIVHILKQCLCQQSYRKYIMAYFEYSKSEHIPKDICPGVNYKLMKHFKELLCHIHGITPGIHNLGDFDLPLDGQHASTPKGLKLINACHKASEFEKKNPKWFQDMYGTPISTDDENSGRHDSGIDTYSPNLSDDDKHSMNSDKCTIGKDDISWLPPSELRVCPKHTCHVCSFSDPLFDVESRCNGCYVTENGFFPPDHCGEYDVTSRTASDVMAQINTRYEQDLYGIGMKCVTELDSESLGGQSV